MSNFQGFNLQVTMGVYLSVVMLVLRKQLVKLKVGEMVAVTDVKGKTSVQDVERMALECDIV